MTPRGGVRVDAIFAKRIRNRDVPRFGDTRRAVRAANRILQGALQKNTLLSTGQKSVFLIYFTTILMIFPGTTISLTIVLPAIAAVILSSALTAARISSFDASAASVTVPFILPLI